MGIAIPSPSILVHYLNAIGPGTVICKTGPNNFDIRFDGTAHEILRSLLKGYRWLPVAEKVPSPADAIIGALESDKDDTNIQFYKRYFPAGASRLKSSKETPNQPITDLKGPVVIVGKPTTFAGIDGDKNNSNVLNALLQSCGFFEDANAQNTNSIFVGRSNAFQTVIVFNGNTTQDTLAGVVLACESGTARLDAAIYKHIESPKTNRLILRYALCQRENSWRQALENPEEKTLDDSNSEPNPIEITRKSRELEQLAKSETQLQSQDSHLVQYLRSHGPASIIVKSYPAADSRDDETAKDIILQAIPNAQIFPVRDAPPQSLSKERLSNFLEWLKGDDLGQQLAKADELLIQRANSWLQQFDTSNRVDAENIPSSGPVIVLGTPESYCGGGEAVTQQSNSGLSTEEELPQPTAFKTALQRLIHSGGYPNRYILDLDHEENICMVDRKSLSTKTIPHISTNELNNDIGMIHIGLGLNQRLIVIIAGANWLGTYAGAHILFKEKLPELDKHVESLLSGKAKQIDIAFQCTRHRKGHTLGITYDFLFPIDKAFTWGKTAENVFMSLFAFIGQENGKNKVFIDNECFKWEVAKNDNKIDILIHAKSVRDIADTKFFCSEPTKKTLQAIDDACQFIQKANLPGRRVHPFLIVAPTGTGKESVASYIHNKLREERRPFKSANASVFVPTLFQSELFGIVAGAAFGVNENRPGFVGAARGGSLFLDEFLEGTSDIQDKLQPALLRLIDNGEYNNVGSDATIPADIVLICATNIGDCIKGLEDTINSDDRRIRPDLFGRFKNQFEFLKLRDRPIEILPTFVYYIATTLKLKEFRVNMSLSALRLLLYHDFPYNFRTIKQIAEKIAARHCGDDLFITTAMMFEALRIQSQEAAHAICDEQSICVSLEVVDHAALVFTYNKSKWKGNYSVLKDYYSNGKTFSQDDGLDGWFRFLFIVCCGLEESCFNKLNPVLRAGEESLDKSAVDAFLEGLAQYLKRVSEKMRESIKYCCQYVRRSCPPKYRKNFDSIFDGKVSEASGTGVLCDVMTFCDAKTVHKEIGLLAVWLLTGSDLRAVSSDAVPEEDQEVDGTENNAG